MHKKVIVSLKNTRYNDEYLTLWRPNNAGYTNSLSSAGKYEESELENGYHSNVNTMPVDWPVAIDCSIETDEYGLAIPNDSYTREKLGISIVDKKLVYAWQETN